MSDLISRKWLMECVDEGWIKFDTEKDKNIYVHLVRDIAPPAQPEQCGDKSYTLWKESYEELKRRMDELTSCSDIISRQAALDALARMMPRSYTPDGSHPGDEEIFRAQEVFADCIEALEILPSAQPEIIRCKDCKHRDKYGCCKYWKGLAMGDIPIATDDYDFCSYAKRI